MKGKKGSEKVQNVRAKSERQNKKQNTTMECNLHFFEHKSEIFFHPPKIIMNNTQKGKNVIIQTKKRAKRKCNNTHTHTHTQSHISQYYKRKFLQKQRGQKKRRNIEMT